MKLDRAQLVAAADELNNKLGIDPPIDTSTSRSDLKEKVRQAAEMVEPQDKLSQETRKIVDYFLEDSVNGDQENGQDESKQESPDTEDGNGQPESTGQEESEDTGEKDKPDSVDSKPKSKSQSKGNGKKQSAKQPADKPKNSYGRLHSLYDALKKGGTRQEIIEESDRLYQEAGGAATKTGAKTTVDIHLPALQFFGVVEMDANGKYKLIK